MEDRFLKGEYAKAKWAYLRGYLNIKKKYPDFITLKKEQETHPLPEVNFSSFLLSLSSSVLLHLGEIADPQSGEKRKDLALAKQSIDIIGILKDKTKGNLSEEEGKLLQNLLYDLRMRFVAASKQE